MSEPLEDVYPSFGRLSLGLSNLGKDVRARFGIGIGRPRYGKPDGFDAEQTVVAVPAWERQRDQAIAET